MSTSLRLVMFFLIIVSVIDCVKVKVEIKPVLEENGSSIKQSAQFFTYKVSYDGIADAKAETKEAKETKVSNEIIKEYGNLCLRKGEKATVVVMSVVKSEATASLFTAVDSEDYDGVTDNKLGYSSELEVNNDSELCFLWGSWLPSKIVIKNDSVKEGEEETTYPKVYFRILTKDIDRENKFLLLFDNKAFSNNLLIRLKLDLLNSSKNTLSKLISNIPEIKNLICHKEILIKNDAHILNQKFNHNGDGCLRMYIVADESETKDIKKYLNDNNLTLSNFFTTHNGELSEWSNLKCLDTGFEYKRKAPTKKEETPITQGKTPITQGKTPITKGGKSHLLI